MGDDLSHALQGSIVIILILLQILTLHLTTQFSKCTYELIITAIHLYLGEMGGGWGVNIDTYWN